MLSYPITGVREGTLQAERDRQLKNRKISDISRLL